MPDVVVGHIEAPESLEPVFAEFNRHHLGLTKRLLAKAVRLRRLRLHRQEHPLNQ